MIPGSEATASLRRLLSELGETHRTGALHIGGSPGGALYLVAGRIAYAETAACPGIGERLVASGRLSAAVWRAAYQAGRGTHAVGRMLLRDGHLGANELACRVAAAIQEATLALLQSDDAAPVRFAPGARHWLGTVTVVDLSGLGHRLAVRALTGRRCRMGGSPRPRAGRLRHDAHGVRPMGAPSPEDGPR